MVSTGRLGVGSHTRFVLCFGVFACSRSVGHSERDSNEGASEGGEE